MKKIKIIYKIIIMIFVSIAILTQNIVYASMADYDDETADKIMEQEQEEWNKKQEEVINKSSNNYLKSLSIENYEITPKFDKQIINYEVEKEVAEDTIVVKAEADDERTTVSGIGNITLNSGENNITIDVTAENGTVRSYYIKIVKTTNKDINNDKIVYQSNVNKERKEEIEPKKDNQHIMIIASIAIICLIVALIVIKIRKK